MAIDQKPDLCRPSHSLSLHFCRFPCSGALGQLQATNQSVRPVQVDGSLADEEIAAEGLPEHLKEAAKATDG